MRHAFDDRDCGWKHGPGWLALVGGISYSGRRYFGLLIFSHARSADSRVKASLSVLAGWIAASASGSSGKLANASMAYARSSLLFLINSSKTGRAAESLRCASAI